MGLGLWRFRRSVGSHLTDGDGPYANPAHQTNRRDRRLGQLCAGDRARKVTGRTDYGRLSNVLLRIYKKT